MGLGNLAYEGLILFNRAPENTVKEATHIFEIVISGITINDAKTLLLGNNNAMTLYLQSTTSDALYAQFKHVIKKSFANVGTDKIWKNIITKYNAIPFVSRLNPDLSDYRTREALNGAFTMIAIEEKEIRTKVSSRTTTLLKKVFALQD